MLNFQKVLNFILSFSSLLMTSFDAVRFRGLTCADVGPFELGHDDANVVLNYLPNFRYEEVYERMTLSIHDGPLVYSRKNPSHEVRAEIIQTFGFTIPLKDYLTRDGLDISFIVTDYTTKDNITSNTATIFPIAYETINPFHFDSRTYLGKDIAFHIIAGKVTSYNCVYYFDGLKEYFDDINYPCLDFTKYSFTYVSDLPFEYDSAVMKFKDLYHLFPYILTDDNDYKYIDLALENHNGEINLAMKRPYFYNEKTSRISSIWKDGWKSVTDFYFPNNAREKLKDYEFIFELKGVGANKMDIVYSAFLESDKNVFGACNDSEYCINGGILK